ncbi:MAG: winged helix-turn-helix domain-containing protein [Candidatus Sericytochromatia bacterium]|nr:winged helix-turn-helix domain-containing protein [Candidatus Sericytochromatia bacterium]
MGDDGLERLLLAMWQDGRFPLRPIRSRGELERLLSHGPHGGIVLDLAIWPRPPLADWCLDGRGVFRGRPVILVAPMAMASDRAAWFAEGATDVLLPPFEVTELFLLLQARLRQGGTGHRRGLLVRGDVVLDLDRAEWREGERCVHVTPLEAALLECLLEEPGQVVTMDRLLLEGLGHPAGQGSPEAVRNHIRNLRVKLERCPDRPERLRNIPGVGYLLQLSEVAGAARRGNGEQTFT